ncbi:MAG TPA: heme o synthase [Candidatus Saccharimonadales bacterium]|nr:heme o synthase [Candidatus Saccharimonadales bacterium]
MLKKYVELTKPERTLANVITAAAGFLLASQHSFDLRLFAAMIVGLSLLVASACALNNVIDRKLDVQMARTKKRVLVTGSISPNSALIFSILLGFAGIVILYVYVSWLVVVLGLIAYFDYIVLYGYYKRHSPYGTLVGTICGAIPMVAGYCAVVGKLDITALVLFLSMTFWQMAHFYSIAIFRLKDYKNAGIPVWPAVYGIKNTKIQILFFIIAFMISSVSLSIFGQTGIVYFAILLCACLYWLRIGLRGWKTENDTKWARGMFMVSLKVLMIFAAGIAIGAHVL